MQLEWKFLFSECKIESLPWGELAQGEDLRGLQGTECWSKTKNFQDLEKGDEKDKVDPRCMSKNIRHKKTYEDISGNSRHMKKVKSAIFKSEAICWSELGC